MDDARFEELTAKRDGEGLNDAEADELGRLMAEREGRPYSNADSRPDAEPGAAEASDAGDSAPIEPAGDGG